MALTPEELEGREAHFRERTTQYECLGHDRNLAASFVVDAAGDLEGPVLDLGTGMGIAARELARRGLEVVSADVSAEDQQVAAHLTKDPTLAARIRFTLADGADLPFPNAHFGSAVTLDALHHLADGAAVLKELARVVRPGGVIVLADFSPGGLALVSKVHASEGRVHAEGPATLDWARGFMAGWGLRERETREGHLHRVAVFEVPASSSAPAAFAGMDRADLLNALDLFAKSWLAHDGCWFLAAEERLGMDVAMDLDARSWKRFAAAEAKRILDGFGISGAGGLESLERALGLRMYAFLNPQRAEWSPGRQKLCFTMDSCRVREARHRKGLPPFPCKPVGEVEFEAFARAVDPRIRVRCLHCPTEPSGERGCSWEFWIEPAGEAPDG